MIQRAEQKHGVDARVGMRQAAGVSNTGAHPDALFVRVRERLLDMELDRIEHLHLEARGGQRHRVNATCAAHVEDERRGRRQEPRQQLLRPNEFEPTTRLAQTIPLVAERVVADDVRIERHESATSSTGIPSAARSSPHGAAAPGRPGSRPPRTRTPRCRSARSAGAYVLRVAAWR